MAIVMLLGPTAAGKTATALALAERTSCQLISMDSAMIYRGMDIGTAKPDAATLARHPHALIDIRDAAQSYSAAAFVQDADRAAIQASRQGKLPVVVGGAMLYARAFRDGLADLPQASSEVRDAIEARAVADGWPALHKRLAAVDPPAAAAIHPNNPQRLQRALEVYETTGRPISAFWREQAHRGVAERLGEPLLTFAVMPDDRRLLHGRIAERFDAMLDAGFTSEVCALRARGDLHPGLPSMRAVGYRQMWRYLEGRLDAGEMRDRAIAATRQLAKKQFTWLRKWQALEVLDWNDPGAAAGQVLDRLRAVRPRGDDATPFNRPQASENKVFRPDSG